MRKLETFISYEVYRSERAFENKIFEDEFSTKKEAKDSGLGKIIKVCCCVTIPHDGRGECSEFAYGDTVSEAKKNMKELLKYYGFTI